MVETALLPCSIIFWRKKNKNLSKLIIDKQNITVRSTSYFILDRFHSVVPSHNHGGDLCTKFCRCYVLLPKPLHWWKFQIQYMGFVERFDWFVSHICWYLHNPHFFKYIWLVNPNYSLGGIQHDMWAMLPAVKLILSVLRQ